MARGAYSGARGGTDDLAGTEAVAKVDSVLELFPLVTLDALGHCFGTRGEAGAVWVIGMFPSSLRSNYHTLMGLSPATKTPPLPPLAVRR